jgi:hypothetical protein
MPALTRLLGIPELHLRTFGILGRHFAPLFAVGGLPWVAFALIPAFLGQPRTLADLVRARAPLSWELLQPFLWADLFGLAFFLLVNGSLVHAVARFFSAASARGGDVSDPAIMVAGKRVDPDLVALSGGGQGKPGLRFDKVATRLVGHLRDTLGEAVPDGLTVLLAVTAPIRLPARTAAEIGEKVRTLAKRGAPGRQRSDTINGNGVRVLCLRDESGRAPKVLAFVHNPEPDAQSLFGMVREMLELNAAAGRRMPMRAGDRWLVGLCAGDSSFADVYRHIYSLLPAETACGKTLLVCRDQRVAVLAE